jgi:hypothetical protein
VTLSELLDELKVKEAEVRDTHFWSIEVEGSELRVLRGVRWTRNWEAKVGCKFCATLHCKRVICAITGAHTRKQIHTQIYAQSRTRTCANTAHPTRMPIQVCWN